MERKENPNRAIQAFPKLRIGWLILAMLGFTSLIWGFGWAGEDLQKLQTMGLEPEPSVGNLQVALVFIGGVVMLLAMLRATRTEAQN